MLHLLCRPPQTPLSLVGLLPSIAAHLLSFPSSLTCSLVFRLVPSNLLPPFSRGSCNRWNLRLFTWALIFNLLSRLCNIPFALTAKIHLFRWAILAGASTPSPPIFWDNLFEQEEWGDTFLNFPAPSNTSPDNDEAHLSIWCAEWSLDPSPEHSLTICNCSDGVDSVSLVPLSQHQIALDCDGRRC